MRACCSYLCNEIGIVLVLQSHKLRKLIVQQALMLELGKQGMDLLVDCLQLLLLLLGGHPATITCADNYASPEQRLVGRGPSGARQMLFHASALSSRGARYTHAVLAVCKDVCCMTRHFYVSFTVKGGGLSRRCRSEHAAAQSVPLHERQLQHRCSCRHRIVLSDSCPL